MLIKEILPATRVECGIDINSKKAALEHLAAMLAPDSQGLTAIEIFDSLIAREKLGSTGLGDGISIPHGRMAGLTETMGAFLRIRQGVDFDAIDNKPVDMFFALLVPEESTEEHLDILALLAEMFSDNAFLERLRDQTEPVAIHHLLTDRAR